MKNIQVGDLVAFNMLDDAAWFEVVQIDGFRMIVRDVEVENPAATQYSDTSLVRQVRKAQQYEVIVQNVGCVLQTSDLDEAQQSYHEWVMRSTRGLGRAAGEGVYLLRNNEDIILEHFSEEDAKRLDEEENE